MNSPRLGLRVASIIFGLMCLGHVWRLVAHTDIRVGHHHVHMWVSGVAIIIAGVLSIWLWTLSKR